VEGGGRYVAGTRGRYNLEGISGTLQKKYWAKRKVTKDSFWGGAFTFSIGGIVRKRI